jgi:hypothetical protein
VDVAAQSRTQSALNSASTIGVPATAMPVAQTVATQANSLMGATLDQVENQIKLQQLQQVRLGVALKEARTDASVIDSPASMGGLQAIGPTAAIGALALAVAAVTLWIWQRWKYQHSHVHLEVQDAFSDSSQLASGYGDDVAHIDELVERFSNPNSTPLSNLQEQSMARAESAALREVAPVDLPDSVLGHEEAEGVDIELEVWDSEVFDLQGEPAGPTGNSVAQSAQTQPTRSGEAVSDEVQKVLKSLAEKRAARSAQQRVLQPSVMLEPMVLAQPVNSAPAPLASDDIASGSTASPATGNLLDLSLDEPPAPFTASLAAPHTAPYPQHPSGVTASAPAMVTGPVQLPTVAAPALTPPPLESLHPTEHLPWQTQLDLAHEFAKLGQYDEARQLYNEVLAHSPNQAVQSLAQASLKSLPAGR